LSIHFQSQKEIKRQEEYQAHRKERKELRRSAGEITKGLKQKPKYWIRYYEYGRYVNEWHVS
jgi:hypothetical protein